MLANIVLADGRVVNRELVRAGFAWWFRRYASRDRALAALEEEARGKRLGLWADAAPEPPWVFRKDRP
jgi:endonuclease YncB( thermonuclease family)